MSPSVEAPLAKMRPTSADFYARLHGRQTNVRHVSPMRHTLGALSVSSIFALQKQCLEPLKGFKLKNHPDKQMVELLLGPFKIIWFRSILHSVLGQASLEECKKVRAWPLKMENAILKRNRGVSSTTYFELVIQKKQTFQPKMGAKKQKTHTSY